MAERLRTNSPNYQQHKRTGYLKDNQAIAKPVTPSGNAAAAFVQDSIHIRPCDPQGRHASYNDSSQQSDGKGIEEYPPIERE